MVRRQIADGFAWLSVLAGLASGLAWLAAAHGFGHRRGHRDAAQVTNVIAPLA